MSRSEEISAIAQLLKSIVDSAPGFEQRLTIVYLINDVLHHGLECAFCFIVNFVYRLRTRPSVEIVDDFASAFQPHMAAIVKVTYRGEPTANQDKLFKVLQVWSDKKIYPAAYVQLLQSGAISADKVLSSSFF